MTEKLKLDRRDFLKQAAGVLGTAIHVDPFAVRAEQDSARSEPRSQPSSDSNAPRQFRGRQLKMISFPLGGVAAGSIGLGGRGQLINWEIFNRPNKGFRPPYAFAAIWAQAGNEAPVARVLESRILPPYEGQDGLGSNNVPGLSRLEAATFSAQYPLAHIDFQDHSFPVRIELEDHDPRYPFRMGETAVVTIKGWQ